MMEQKRKLLNAYKRMTNRALAGAWNKWEAVIAANRRNMGGILNRWKNRHLSMAYNQWRDVYAWELARLAMAKAVKRWTNAKLSAAVGKWREYAEESRLAKLAKAAGFWLNGKVAAAWNTWREWYFEKIRVKKSEAVDDLLMAEPPKRAGKLHPDRKSAEELIDGLSPEDLAKMSPAERARAEAKARGLKKKADRAAAVEGYANEESNEASFNQKSSSLYDVGGGSSGGGSGGGSTHDDGMKNLGPAYAKLKGLKTKLDFETLYSEWSNMQSYLKEGSEPPQVTMRVLLTGRAAQDLGYQPLVEAWGQPGATGEPQGPISLKAAFAMGRERNLDWTGTKANLDVQKVLTAAAEVEQLQDQNSPNRQHTLNPRTRHAFDGSPPPQSACRAPEACRRCISGAPRLAAGPRCRVLYSKAGETHSRVRAHTACGTRKITR